MRGVPVENSVARPLRPAVPTSLPAPGSLGGLLVGKVLVALLLFAPLLIARPARASADPAAGAEVTLLVHGGTVITMDAAGTVVANGAVALAGGRIEAVGDAARLAAAYPAAPRLDAAGGIIMPGLINTHTHAPMVLFRGLADDLELMEWLEGHIFPAEARHVDEDFVRWGTRLACLEMLRGGTTTIVDMYYFEDAIAEEADRCGLRAVLGETLIDFPAPDHRTWDDAIGYARNFVERWRGHPRITPAIAPHSTYTVSPDHLAAAHALATELDVPMLIHLAEDRAEIARVTERTGKSSIDYLDSLGLLDSRVVAAHVVWPSASEIELLARRDFNLVYPGQETYAILPAPPPPVSLPATWPFWPVGRLLDDAGT